METAFYSDKVAELILRFGFNILVAVILIRFIYARTRVYSTYKFTFLMFNTLIFFVCYLLSNVTMSIGFAFGLFAVFAILRYRTDPIPIKEMTYLFAVITIGVMNAMSTPEISVLELLFANIAIITVAYVLENVIRGAGLEEIRVTYEKIENIPTDRHDELMADLRERTGLEIQDIEIERLDFLRDVARIRIRYISGSTNK